MGLGQLVQRHSAIPKTYATIEKCPLIRFDSLQMFQGEWLQTSQGEWQHKYSGRRWVRVGSDQWIPIFCILNVLYIATPWKQL